MASNEDILRRLIKLERENEDAKTKAKDDQVLDRLDIIERKTSIVQGKDETPDTDNFGRTTDISTGPPPQPPFESEIAGLEVEFCIPTADITEDSATVTLQPCSIAGVEYADADTATLYVCDDRSEASLSDRGWIATVVAVEADPEADPPVEAVEGVTGTILRFVRYPIDGDDAVGALFGGGNYGGGGASVEFFSPHGTISDGTTLSIDVVDSAGDAMADPVETISIFGACEGSSFPFSRLGWTTSTVGRWLRDTPDAVTGVMLGMPPAVLLLPALGDAHDGIYTNSGETAWEVGSLRAQSGS